VSSSDRKTTAGDVYRAFGRLQVARLFFRLQLVIKATVAVAFWVGMAALYIRADQAGLGWAVIVLAAAWALLVIPHMIFEASIVLDAVGYFLTGRARVYAWLQNLPALEEGDQSAKRASRLAFVISIAGLTSPLNALAVWCYGVLLRVPAHAYAKSVKKVRQPKLAPATVQIRGQTYIRREFLRRYSAATRGEMAFV